jgi:hypothetical protein
MLVPKESPAQYAASGFAQIKVPVVVLLELLVITLWKLMEGERHTRWPEHW